MSEMNASAKWTDGDRFIGIAPSGHAMVIDAGTEKTASSPVELVLMALCACTAADVVSILRKKREPFTSVDVLAESERAPEPPKVFTKIKLIYRVSGEVNRKSVEDAVRLSVDKYCSVEAMLKKTVEISFSIELV
jgi:putative redox protein